MINGMFGGKFLPFHLGHYSMILKASTTVDKLYVILSYSEIRDQILTEKSSIKEMPYKVRLRWLIEATKDMPNVQVIAVEDTAVDDESYDWEKGAFDVKNAIGENIDMIFGSEESYCSIFKENYPNAIYHCLDPDRSAVPISATQIRNEGVFKHWDFIPSVVRPYFIKKVAIVGTESCGKSTLVEKLANHFNTTYVEEFGRTYCEQVGGSNGILFDQDFMNIAFGHKTKEEQKLRIANKLFFIDSEAIVTQYYSILYGEGKLVNLDGIIHSQNYDLVLFLEPDVPWIQDGTRHHGETKIRINNNNILKGLFIEYNVPFVSIDGGYDTRFEKSAELINSLF